MRVAIIGAGFSGLATCWHLLQRSTAQSSITITIFDHKGIGGGASGMSAGLLHPFAGLHAKYNKLGQEGMQASLNLFKVAEDALHEPVHEQQGILRLAISDEQKVGYAKCAEKYSDDVEWWDADRCREVLSLPQLTHSGIFIKQGITVYTEKYLAGLWLACEKRGTTLRKEKCTSISDLSNFDLIIIAAGAAVKNFAEAAHLPVTSVKGQLLEAAWPQDIPPLSMPINSLGYAVMTQNRQRCVLGSTYERDYQNEEPDITTARKDILPKLLPFLPSLQHAHIVTCKAGIRASTPDHFPIVKQLSAKCWVITGMGSKGLLYHALMAEKLVSDLF